MKQALTKKLGPLPRWAWAGILLSVLLLLYLRKRSQANAANSQTPSDPYSSYNTQGNLQGGGYPYDSSAVGGTYPLGGGLGSGFDPTSFNEGLTYGQGFGTGTNTANTGTSSDSSNPNDNGATGDTLPPAQGGDITVNTAPSNSDGGSGSTGPGGSKGHGRKKTPTKGKGKTGQHPGTQRHTSTGGGQPHRHTGTHTKQPNQGTHKAGNNHKLTGGGSQHPGRTHVTPTPAHHQAPGHPTPATHNVPTVRAPAPRPPEPRREPPPVAPPPPRREPPHPARRGRR